MKIASRIVPGIVAGSLLLGTASGVFAAGKHQRAATGPRASGQFAFARGQVSNLTASGFTLTFTARKAAIGTAAAATQTVQVTTSATTKFVAATGTTGALANDQYARVVGTANGNAIAALRVHYSATLPAPRGHVGLFAVGTVSGSTATSLSITTKNGTSLTFVVNAATKYRVGKQVVTVAPSFAGGQKVVVHYTKDATTGTLTAKGIAMRSAGA